MRLSLNKLLLTALFYFLSSGFFTLVGADTVYLQNGRRMEGIIKYEDQDIIELEVKSGSVKFNRSTVVKTTRSSPEEQEQMRQEWQSQLQATQEAREHAPRDIGFSGRENAIYLNVELDNKITANMILDTGASLVILNGDIAQKMGFDLKHLEPNMRIILANGSQARARRIFLDRVSVQDVSARNVEAAILLDNYDQPNMHDGLLGMSFLKNFHFSIDYSKNKLILEKR